MGTIDNKYSTNPWKVKLKLAQKEKKRLAQSLARKQAQNRALREKAKAQSKELSGRMAKQACPPQTVPLPAGLGTRPKGHRYSLFTIKLCLTYQVVLSMSYRQACAAIRELALAMGLAIAVPSHCTVRQWVLKQGLYNLQQGTGGGKGGYALVVDESAGIGQEKGLVVLGVPLDGLEKAGPVSFEGTEVLCIASRTSWKAKEVAEKVREACRPLSDPVRYIVSDRCSTMVKAIGDSGHVHVTDCTHWMANCLERYYKKDARFVALQPHLGKVRQKLVNGKNVGMMAPNMRTKARFLNLGGITDWMEKVLAHWDRLDGGQKALLGFVQANKGLAGELSAMMGVVGQLSKMLKCGGIKATTLQGVRDIFDRAGHKFGAMERFRKDMEGYVEGIRDKLPGLGHILCCSDVIESYFGKFKHRGNKAASQGITKDLLSVCLFNGKLSHKQVLDAMENTTWAGVKAWAKQNLAPSFGETKLMFWRNLASKT